jgi:ABC-type multidrug transport system fused ATPase/permease subunit
MKELTAHDAVRASLRLLAARDRKRLLVAAFFGMAASLLDVAGVLLLGLVATLGTAMIAKSAPPRFVDDVVTSLGLGSWSTEKVLAVVALAACVFLLAKSAAAVYINRRTLRFLANRQFEISSRLTREVLAQPLLQVQSRSSQLTTYALTDGVSIATITILSSAVVGLTEVAMLVSLGLTLFVLQPLVTLGATAFFAVVVLLMQLGLGRRMSRTGRISAETSVLSWTLIQEALGTYREIFVLDRRHNYAERVASIRRQNADAMAEQAYLILLPKYVLEAALVLGAVILGVSQFLWSDTAAAIGTATLFLAASTRILPSILRLQQAVLALRGAAGGAQPTYDLATEVAGADVGLPRHMTRQSLRLSAGHNRERFEGSIEVRGVELVYPGSPVAALQDVSFFAPAGSSVALVGPSGAGKSTLADVIMGALEPDAGTVELGGVSPIAAIGGWPGSVAYVPQSIYLANATIRENVALGLTQEQTEDAAVWKALGRAQLEDFVRSLSTQLDTPIGENGTRLSGGQQQRLGLARALYTEPTVLVLDEATSSLDAETEYAITETIRGLQGEVTILVIAHRLSTVFNSDLVMYLENGRIIASGSFEDVRSSVPRFERQAQLSGM